MTRRRAFLILFVLPAVVSLVVTLETLTVWERQQPQQQVVVLPTHSSTALIEPRATFPPETASAAASAGVVLVEKSPEGDDATADSTEPVVSEGCENPVHAVEGGQVLGSIAEQYSVSVDDLITLNQILDPEFDPNFLFIGQELAVPICGIPTATPTGIPPNTAVPTRNVPTPINTATNPPAGAVAITISAIRNAGDITSEALEIVNQG